MFYDHAETTRLLVRELGARAFRNLNYDAMRAAGVLIEAYLRAVEQEDEAALDRIDAAAEAGIAQLVDLYSREGP